MSKFSYYKYIIILSSSRRAPERRRRPDGCQRLSFSTFIGCDFRPLTRPEIELMQKIHFHLTSAHWKSTKLLLWKIQQEIMRKTKTCKLTRQHNEMVMRKKTIKNDVLGVFFFSILNVSLTYRKNFSIPY